MDRRGDSLYRPVSAAELLAARTCRFDPHFFEYGGPPHGSEWKLRHWLPIDAEAYAAFTLPWNAYTPGGFRVGDPHEPFETIAEAYERINLPVPQPLTLAAWRADFRIYEDRRLLPPLVRSTLDRFSAGADWIFARCWHGQDLYDLKIERGLFLELEDPFIELPQPYGFTAIFPNGVAWYLMNSDTVPLVYVAGPAGLISAIEVVAPGRVVGVQLDDPTY